jgi:hypothetical protein
MKWTWLEDLPTQQALAVLCVVLWIPTAACALTDVKVAEWWPSTLVTLTFATVMHYGIKRWTYKPDSQEASTE